MPFWQQSAPATRESIAAFELDNNLPLPQDFNTFLCWSNGGQGTFSAIYLDLWRVETFTALNRDYQINRYLGPKCIAFGSDGGPRCFLLDYRHDLGPSVASCDFGDLDVAELRFVAHSFSAFLQLALTGALVAGHLCVADGFCVNLVRTGTVPNN